MFRHTTSRVRLSFAAVLVVGLGTTGLHAWGPQGHRLVALVAENQLTSLARQNVAWLLDNGGMAGVAVWADGYRDGNTQTGFWHYVNIPLDAKAYDRDRDCPRQPGVAAGASADRWRDCVVDRITYNGLRLADTSLDRVDRATALKFLVHFIGDLHQPFHALGLERGGNGIPVVFFGSSNCPYPDGTPQNCNLHSVWDLGLIGRRKLGDEQYLPRLLERIKQRRLSERAGGTPAEWAIESHARAKAALVPARRQIDDAYYRVQIEVIDDSLALGGVRLAAALNRALTSPPPRVR